MTIKPTKAIVIYCIAGIALLAMCGIAFYINFHSVWLGLIPYLFIVCLIPFYVSSLRTFIFDENGCTVYLGKYRKQYGWNELHLKQHVSYNSCVMTATRTLCRSAVELCPRKVNIPAFMDGHAYSSVFHPLSFIFVYFPREDGRLFDAYVANEEQFFEKLAEWNVVLEQTER